MDVSLPHFSAIRQYFARQYLGQNRLKIISRDWLKLRHYDGKNQCNDEGDTATRSTVSW